MEFEIRLATIENLEEIQRLSKLQFENELHNGFDTTLNSEWSFSEDGENYYKKSIIEDDRCVFVAFVDNKVIGYLEGEINESGSNRALSKLGELNYMFISEECRGMGIGANLHQAFVGWCKQKGVVRLRTEASAKNSSAINFYRKNGFVDYDLILEKDI